MKSNFLLPSIFLLSLFLLAGCSSNGGKSTNTNTIQTDNITKPKELPFPEKVQRLDSLKQTLFLPTLETNFDTKKNAIYAASLLMAWDEIKNLIKEPIIKIESDELKQINNSKSHLGVLTKGEYKSSIEIKDFKVIAKAFFNKSLPFAEPQIRADDQFKFLNNKVVFFNVSIHDHIAGIMYYNHDNDFMLKLKPKDRNHEIILVKSTFPPNSNSTNLIQQCYNKASYAAQTRNRNHEWRFELKEEDKIRIPILQFNLENNYKKIEGTSFASKTSALRVGMMYQKTAFVLNQNGAAVKSEAVIMTDSTSVADTSMFVKPPQPKNLIFDKPFLILLKRTDSKNPYFAMFVANTELMERQ